MVKRQSQDPGKALDRFFARAVTPSAEQIDRSREVVSRNLRAEPLQPADGAPVPGTRRRGFGVRLGGAIAAMAVLAFGIIFFAHHQSYSETVATASDGSRYRLGDPIRARGPDGMFLRLADGSRFEMRSNTKVSLESASDGLAIRLNSGEVIVTAAKQRSGHLYVKTRDVTVSVAGTVFLVDAGEQGSRVAVIQGEVRVRQAGQEKRLHPGEQVTSNPRMIYVPMPEEVSWSRDAESHRALLAQAVSRSQEAATAPAAPQTVETPKWEAVSIHPCNEESTVPGGRGAGPRPSIGRITFECMTVQQMISLAYERFGQPVLNASGRLGADPDKLRGGPSWVRRDKYRIEAKAEGAPSTAVMSGPMLRTILEDRFQLRLHRETEEVPMYALVVAKGGLKIQPVGPDDCRKRTPEDNFTYEQMLNSIRRGEKPYCGLNGGSEGPNIIMDFGWSTLSTFANFLSGSMDRHVLDKTGVDGHFNIHFEYARDENTSAHFGDAEDRSDVPPGPSIFNAIESLGLKLEATKGPREYMLIDGVERPSEN